MLSRLVMTSLPRSKRHLISWLQSPSAVILEPKNERADGDCMQVKKHQLELDIEQQTGSKSGKEYFKAVYCHPAYLTYMQNISCEMLGWMKHKMESRLPGEISMTSDMQMAPHLWQKVRKN